MFFLMKNYKSEDEKTICRFYEQMNADCDCNTFRVVWEWLSNAPCMEMFKLDKSGIWYENNEVAAFLRLTSPWLGSVVSNSSRRI